MTIATLVTVPFKVSHAYWVIMVAGVALQVSHSLRFTTIRVIHWVLGTLGGIALFGLLALGEPEAYGLVILLATSRARRTWSSRGTTGWRSSSSLPSR